MLADARERVARELPGHDLAVVGDDVVVLGVDDVEAETAGDRVSATVRLHGDPVGPCLPEDRVSTSAALQEVAAGTALDPIVPTAAADRVGAGRSDEPVRTVGARQLGCLRCSQHHECDEHGERGHAKRGTRLHPGDKRNEFPAGLASAPSWAENPDALGHVRVPR